MIATSASWNHEPFIEGIALPLQATFDEALFDRMTHGLIPVQMEDKWFAFYEQPYLYLHRSWTGLPTYRLRFQRVGSGAKVTEVLWCSQHVKTDADSQLQDESERLRLLLQALPFGYTPPEGAGW